MASPFPGMDPYLENPELWQSIHSRLIVAIADFLVPLLRPKYRVDIERRIYQTSGEDSILVGIPDVAIQQASQTKTTDSTVMVATPPNTPITVSLPMPEIVRQGYLHIRDVVTGEVVTAVEVLSPTNKRPGRGREAYLSKRLEILVSFTNLVEIDLLRYWQPIPVISNDTQCDYRILVSRSESRPRADLYCFTVRQKIPAFPLPLRSEDESEPIVDLQSLLEDLYDRAGYDLVIDYTHESIPPLSKADTVWADSWLKEKGLRIN